MIFVRPRNTGVSSHLAMKAQHQILVSSYSYVNKPANQQRHVTAKRLQEAVCVCMCVYMYVHVWVWQKTNWSRSLQTLLQAHRVSSASSRCIMMTSSLLLYSSPHCCTSSNTNIQTCMSKPCRTTWLLMLKQLFTGWFKLTDCVFYKRKKLTSDLQVSSVSIISWILKF